MATCFALVRTDLSGADASTAKPQGLGADDLIKAYEIPSSGGEGVTVAIVDAHDDPSAEADLAVYRKQYKLPECSSANGCFKKVGQSGTGHLPSADSGWAEEIALDLEMVSAACPSCKILLVEANTESMANLGAAEKTAARLGAKIISNSWGGPEESSDRTADSDYFKHPGVLITASSGDSGYGVEYPAASPNVLAVGGTRLAKSSSSRGFAESAWSGGGSGCSQYEMKPVWQTDSGCSMRTVVDVAAVADPDNGVAVYATYDHSGGWNVFGGTSVASPLVAGIFARAGLAGESVGFVYDHASAFHDLKSGSNGSCDSSAGYLCKARVGYDGPTGMGSPDGKTLASAAK
jgi:subtilase family serine protease